MQVRIFTIPIIDTGTMQEEMNKFLRGHKVLEVQQELVTNNKGSYWCFCIRFIQGGIVVNGEKKGKIDYKEVLSEEVFVIYNRLRECRKILAEKEGVPVYAVFTNAELAKIAAYPATFSLHPTRFGYGIQKKYFTKNRAITEGSNRVMRGGSWNNNARNCEVSNRNNNNPNNRNNNNGFRIAHSSRLGWMSAFEQVIVQFLYGQIALVATQLVGEIESWVALIIF